MPFRFILLILPTLALASVNIDISGKYSINENNLKVHYDGKDTSIISDAERNTFDLDDNRLKYAAKLSCGQLPDDAYVRNPPYWGGNLYGTYGFQEVIRTLVPTSGKILYVYSNSIGVVQQTFKNKITRPAIFNVGITHPVWHTVSTTWTGGPSLVHGEDTVTQNINYGISIDVANLGGVSFNYTSSWGKNAQQSQNVIIGSSSNIDITLQPGEVVVARLEATRVFVRVEMKYEASLSGQIVLNYANKYKGHHFYGLDVVSGMKSVNLINSKTSREVIDMVFYSDSRVIVTDERNGQTLMDVAF